MMVEELNPLLFPLVNRFYRDNGHKGKARSNERVFVLKQNDIIQAALRACPKADGYLLRSVWVAQAKRRQGFGRLLMIAAMKELYRYPCWCYPYSHLQSFYESVGFRLAELSDVPEALSEQYLNYQRRGESFLLMTTTQR